MKARLSFYNRLTIDRGLLRVSENRYEIAAAAEMLRRATDFQLRKTALASAAAANKIFHKKEQTETVRENVYCGICHETHEETEPMMTTVCGHVFCVETFEQWKRAVIARSAFPTCPLCRKRLY